MTFSNASDRHHSATQSTKVLSIVSEVVHLHLHIVVVSRLARHKHCPVGVVLVLGVVSNYNTCEREVSESE